jgi:hypothetical protein
MHTDPTPPGAEATARPPSRTLGRRTSLPNGRAVLGALLVTLAALGTYVVAAGDDGGPRDRFAVVVRAVSPGARITTADLVFRPMTLDPDVRAHAFADAGRLEGAVALAPLSPGQLLQTSLVAAATTSGGVALAAHEFSFPVPRDRTPPGLRRGEKIAILATYGTGPDAATVVTVQGATVLAYDREDAGMGAGPSARLTVALADPDAVMQTAHASQVAELTVVRATQTDAPLPDRYVRPSTRPTDAKAA